MLEIANEAHKPLFTEIHQLKAGGRPNPYSATSFSVRKSVTKSTRGHKMIFETGRRVAVIILSVNYMHMQAMVQVTQAITKTAPLQQQQITMLLLGGMQLLKQLQTSS